MTRKVRTRSRQFPVSWALLAAVPQVSPTAFSSLSLGLSLLLCPSQPSSLQFPVLGLLAAVPQVSPAAFSSLCLWLSLLLCPSQPSSLLFPVLGLLAAVSQVSPADFSSLSWVSLPLCPRSAQQPSVPCLGSPCCCVPGQPSRLQFPVLGLLAVVPQVSPSSLQFFYGSSPCCFVCNVSLPIWVPSQGCFRRSLVVRKTSPSHFHIFYDDTSVLIFYCLVKYVFRPGHL